MENPSWRDPRSVDAVDALDSGEDSGPTPEPDDVELTKSNIVVGAETDIEQSSSSSTNHCHDGNSIGGVDKVARRKLLLASILCLFFMIGETVGGALAGSLAIMTDAAHLLTDFASFMISLLAIYLASRPATKRMSFGWARAEVVGALVSVLLIWVVTGILVYMAVLRCIKQDYEINAKIMLITSAVGVAFNILMGCTLHQHGHSHGGGGGGHGHSHGGGGGAGHSHEEGGGIQAASETVVMDPAAQNKENINVRAAFIHVIGDFIQSVGVLVAAFIIYFKNDWKIVDPICTFIFSVLVLFTTFTILKDTMLVLMEGAPRNIDYNTVKAALYEVSGVVEVHNLRIWSLTTNKAALSVHVAIPEGSNHEDILRRASAVIRQRFDISDVTMQLEVYREEMADCEECQGPQH